MNDIANTQKAADLADKSLLIVDDDNPLRERLSRAMEKKGFKVIQAESVKQGINAAKKLPPMYAVVDLRLNDGSGLEVVREIQKLKKDSKIVMLTGYGNIPTAVAAVKSGAIDYIPKPADADDVENALLSAGIKPTPPEAPGARQITPPRSPEASGGPQTTPREKLPLTVNPHGCVHSS